MVDRVAGPEWRCAVRRLQAGVRVVANRPVDEVLGREGDARLRAERDAGETEDEWQPAVKKFLARPPSERR